jgi:hypothetical protein
MNRPHEDRPEQLPPGISAHIDRQLRFAIAQKRLIELDIDGRIRIGEPHDYGIFRSKPMLLFYQTRGFSASGGLPSWRLLAVPSIAGVRLLDEHFGGSREAESTRHREWDELFARVS